jgi:aryl-alcohol dehydrogenase-like predicted oxidoreductase
VGAARRDSAAAVRERFGALAELREAGLIRHLGLSNVRPHHLAEAQAVARAHGASAAQVRVAWALHRGPHVLVIPGTGEP